MTTELTPASEPGEEEKKLQRKKNWRDFWIGLVGSILINGGIACLEGGFSYLGAAAGENLPQGNIANIVRIIVQILIYGLPWVLNIAAIVMALVKHRPRIALGIVTSYAVAIALAVIAGIVFAVICAVAYSNPS